MSRIKWIQHDMTGERGCVDGNDLFHLSYPNEWSNRFSLTSPLVFIGQRMGWLGTIEVADPGPETVYHNGERPSRAQVVADFEADKERWKNARDVTKEMAEMILIEFAQSILHAVDEPS